MSLGISAESVFKAHKESDKYFVLNPAEKEFRIAKNDGMILKIPQDNTYDWFVNTFDHRRVILEKKAEILHDYYGDRLVAKDLFKEYIDYKKWTSGAANVLSLGIIGTNLYTRVMKNSIFLGKVGTIAGVIALQSIGRYISNNWLEKKIDRPWKIHTYRMSKGLGPTNVPSNKHEEILTVPYRTMVYSIIKSSLCLLI